MKILITIIDYKYPNANTDLCPEIMDLSEENNVMGLYMNLANGAILEMKVDGENDKALELVRGMITGVGASEPIDLPSEKKKELWLYEEGYDCYKQGSSEPGYIFVNPISDPDKF